MVKFVEVEVIKVAREGADVGDIEVQGVDLRLSYPLYERCRRGRRQCRPPCRLQTATELDRKEACNELTQACQTDFKCVLTRESSRILSPCSNQSAYHSYSLNF